MRILSLSASCCLAALLCGCAVGPDYARPETPAPGQYDDRGAPATEKTDTPHGAAQSFAPGASIPEQWWALYRSPALNDLVTQALLHNPDLDAAKASLRAAEENLLAGGGALYPTIGGDFSATRQKTSSASNGGKFPGSIYSLFNSSLTLSYGVDLFGGTRRAIEQLEAQRAYQAFELEAAKLTLSSNTVTAAIQEALLRGQIAATQKIIDEESKQLDIAKKQLAAGATTKLAVLSLQTSLAQTRANLPPLQKQLDQTRHTLSILAGDTPDHSPAAKFELSDLHLPEQLPLSLPSQLLEQRPDIRAAEANLMAASAAIGVAEAKRFPQFTISADIGSAANQVENLFSPGGGIWSLGGDLAVTIFDAGTLEHKEESARASFDQAVATYRKTVLAGYKDVADTLRALDADAKALQAQTEAEHSAAESLKLAEAQYTAGSISYTELLDSQNAEEKAKLALVQAEAARLSDTAALFQALGGGWLNKEQPKDSPHD